MKLRALRETVGLSREAAALKTNLSPSSVRMIEDGRVLNPRIDTLEKFAAAYGVPLAVVIAALRETREAA